MQGPYYVLGMSALGMHATIQMFNCDSKPMFFQLKEMIVKRLIDEQQGKTVAMQLLAIQDPGAIEVTLSALSCFYFLFYLFA